MRLSIAILPVTSSMQHSIAIHACHTHKLDAWQCRLKAKLTHAFALLRTYQHKIQALEKAYNPSLPACELHPHEFLDCHRQPINERPNNLQSQSDAASALCQSCTQPGMQQQLTAPASPNRGWDKYHQQQRDKSPAKQAATRQHKAQCQIRSAENQPHQAPPLQKPSVGVFADLAAQTAAWQQNHPSSDGAPAPSAVDEQRVLRFDPGLGSDGGFYFVSWDALQEPAPAESIRQPATEPSQVEDNAQVQAVQGQQPVQQSQQLDQKESADASGMNAQESAFVDLSNADGHMHQPAPQMPGHCAADAAKDKAHAVPGQAGARQGHAAATFPVQGGGEAGRLLRAAAAAASGCSHDLVVAAAGPCDRDQAR